MFNSTFCFGRKASYGKMARLLTDDGKISDVVCSWVAGVCRVEAQALAWA